MSATVLLVIDVQNDFCDPEGALFVPGAVEDAMRLRDFIRGKGTALDAIFLSQDTHLIHDISHPYAWQDAEGTPPPPFTPIARRDLDAGRWRPRFAEEAMARYLEALEAQNKFEHLIWPEHCLQGSWGHAFYPPLMEAVLEWSHATGRDYTVVMKGLSPLTEHFGIFEAQIPDAALPETQRNEQLLDALDAYTHIYVAGQARSHCVATSVQQLMDYAPQLNERLVILSDTMSDVPGLGHLGDPIYARARAAGIRFEQVVS